MKRKDKWVAVGVVPGGISVAFGLLFLVLYALTTYSYDQIISVDEKGNTVLVTRVYQPVINDGAREIAVWADPIEDAERTKSLRIEQAKELIEKCKKIK